MARLSRARSRDRFFVAGARLSHARPRGSVLVAPPTVPGRGRTSSASQTLDAANLRQRPPPRYQAATVPVPVRASTPTDRLRIRPHARRAPTVRLRLGHHPCKAGHPWHPGRGHGLRALTVPQGFPAPGQPSARLDLRVVNHLIPLYLVGRTGAKAAGNRAPDARAESPPAARMTHAASHH